MRRSAERYPLTAAQRRMREAQVLIVICLLATVVAMALLIARW